MSESKFVATPAELAWCVAAIIGLIAAGLLVSRWPDRPRDPAAPPRDRTALPPGHTAPPPARTALPPGRTAPRPWVVGAFAFAVTSLYWLRDSLLMPRWTVAVAACALVAAGTVLCVRWSRSRGWNSGHRLALAGGALLTYAWLGIVNAQGLPGPAVVAVSGSAVFGTGAVVLLIMARRRIRKRVIPLSRSSQPGSASTAA